MVTPQEILTDYERGMSFLSDRNVEHIAELKVGCVDCGSDQCLYRILRGLTYVIELGQYDDVSDALHDQLILIIGDYSITFRPQVSAGINKAVEVGNSITFNAVIVQGSAPITNIQWTQVFGASSATLSGANTANLTVSDVEVGDYIFKIEVTDANGSKASDEVVLTATSASTGGSANIFTTPRGKYSTVSATVVDSNSIIVEELIGADLGFFTAHRGFDQTFGGSASAPDPNYVQVDVSTGLVTFFQDFNPDFPQDLWFDYKTGNVIPPDPGTNTIFPFTFPFNFS